MSNGENGLELGGGYAKPRGYDTLGSFMSSFPETAIFRRFGALSAQDLLLRQAELADLEEELRFYQQEDRDSRHVDRERYAVSWDTLKQSVDEDAKDGNDSSQLKTLLIIREKLKDYQDALIRHRQTADLQRPVPGQVKALNEWMERPSMGNVFLQGVDRNLWRDPDFDDLASLAPPPVESNPTNGYTLALIQLYNKLVRIYNSLPWKPIFVRKIYPLKPICAPNLSLLAGSIYTY
ncbi:hypothetical protein B0T16DRAFT_319657 [Cercophora newfieldiana]|uniref:DUF6594 domain-containing protein n=1 Tax=Cercophora newfieldiana TaxID=92897 RepID=A0AA40CY28_9PEZI|nr:hypothetical protein B0T16DRAFT_319657 [Cercophora newfieldiana]